MMRVEPITPVIAPWSAILLSGLAKLMWLNALYAFALISRPIASRIANSLATLKFTLVKRGPTKELR